MVRPTLKLTDIRIDGGTQPRAAIDKAVVADYAKAMQAGAEFPPIVVFFDGVQHWLADGFHRYHACRRRAAATMVAEVHEGTRRDAVLYAVHANAAHGLRRTNADKRRAVETLLTDAEWRQWSDREIARRCGVNHHLVAELRTLTGRTPSEPAAPRTYTTKHGTSATMQTGAIGRLSVHFRSDSPEHYTPAAILDAVVDCLGAIDLDPCSNSQREPNVPAVQHFTVAEDGLSQAWHGRVFMNPPYGREIDAWVQKLVDEHRAGRVTEAIALLPGRIDTQWIERLDDFMRCHVKGRLMFLGNDAPAPFPSVVVYLGEDFEAFIEAFQHIGSIWWRINRADLAGVEFPRVRQSVQERA